ncbi:putative membrane protein [Rubidibacter lacunae KORDI 51-2]|uniref:Putative membrane protein n=1 Tax=Rubidibacter lacunae KORDI 51-2 TaxID=582515 RepID=U5DH18_9CHRO|nr:phage holin family protein [Rubidibacter lacunae]ERN40552.1 putative membrane protein [Rubidibacter lacunae KORDI 51-2]
MGQFILTWIVSAGALFLTARLVPGLEISGGASALIGAGVMGLTNAIVKPILIIFTLPLTIVTLGLFLLVVNAIAFALVGYLTPGFEVNGFFPALFGSLVLAFVSSLLGNLIKDN